MSTKLGKDAKLYRLSTGTRAAWPDTGCPENLSEISNVKDVTTGLTTGEADVTTRAGNGWKQIAATVKEGDVQFEMVWDTDDDGFTAIQTAWFNATSIALAILDGPSTTAGSQGLWADFVVTNFSREEPLEEAIKVKVTVKPARSAVAPQWVKVVAAS